VAGEAAAERRADDGLAADVDGVGKPDRVPAEHGKNRRGSERAEEPRAGQMQHMEKEGKADGAGSRQTRPDFALRRAVGGDALPLAAFVFAPYEILRCLRRGSLFSRLRGLASGEDFLRAADEAEQGKDFADGEGVKFFRPRAHGVLNEDELVGALVRSAGGRLDAHVGGDAAEDDGGDATTAHLQVEIGAVERAPVTLVTTMSVGSGPSSGTISSQPAGKAGRFMAASVWTFTASAKSAAKVTWTRMTGALASRKRWASFTAWAMTSGPERGASGMGTMPFWRSMRTRAVFERSRWGGFMRAWV